MPKSALYDADFYAWASEQATLLRAGRTAEADLDNIAEEIESMGRREKHELKSRLVILLLHILKWRFQPLRRTPCWQATIRIQRLEIRDHLLANPSLKPILPDVITRAYEVARIAAGIETGLAESTFPSACLWSYDEIMDDGFWPDDL
jgi:hypothetical protein